MLVVIVGIIFCSCALCAHSQAYDKAGEAPEHTISGSEPTAQPPLMIVSLSDTPSKGSADDSEEEASVPAYINLRPFSLSQPICLPLESAYISSSFGFRDHPINGEYLFHSGLDLAAAKGTEIRAIMDGTVITAAFESGYGNYIILEHDGGVQTLYAHCSVLCAEPGEAVAKGEKIAEVGATGSATGPHLHIELRYNGQRYDPAYILGGYYS